MQVQNGYLNIRYRNSSMQTKQRNAKSVQIASLGYSIAKFT